MVCGITLKSKKHEADWPRLSGLKDEADALSKRLLRLAEDDALAYDRMVETTRAKRHAPDDRDARSAYEEAVRRAIDVPMSTAEACVGVLRLSKGVASAGTKSASSDVDVARYLAGAGVDGALANVMINLPWCEDTHFGSHVRERADEYGREKTRLLAQRTLDI